MARIIKRYENRKLYDTADRKYVSLEEIAQLIRRGVDVQVIDKATDTDISTHTLTQVIFEEGKKGRNPLSAEMLHDVIRWGNHVLDDGIQQVRQSLDQFMPGGLTRLFGGSNPDEFKQLKARVRSLESMIEQLIARKGEDAGEDSEANSAETVKDKT